MYFQDGSSVSLMQEVRLDVHSDLLKQCQRHCLFYFIRENKITNFGGKPVSLYLFRS